MAIDMADLAAQIEPWLERNFFDTTPVEAALGLAEEAGELCRAVLKQRQGIRGTWREWQGEIAKELGDVFIKLVDVADRSGLDLEQAIMDRWNTIKERDWIANALGHGLPKD